MKDAAFNMNLNDIKKGGYIKYIKVEIHLEISQEPLYAYKLLNETYPLIITFWAYR